MQSLSGDKIFFLDKGQGKTLFFSMSGESVPLLDIELSHIGYKFSLSAWQSNCYLYISCEKSHGELRLR